MDIRIVTPKDMWDILRRRGLIIALSALVAVGVLFGWKLLLWEPRYESTATLYILRQEETPAMAGDVSGNFSLALDVMDDCAYLLGSHAVIEQVIEELALLVSCDELQKAVTVTNPGETRFLEVAVKAESPELARSIADRICEIGAGKIEQTMGLDQVNLYERAVLEGKPCNAIGAVAYVCVGAAAAVLVYCGCIVAFMFEDWLRRGGKKD